MRARGGEHSEKPGHTRPKGIRYPTVDTIKNLLHNAIMAVKPVQISMDGELLRKVDADPEAREKGRSAFIRSAVRLYLSAKERRRVDERISQAYSGQADGMLDEISDLVGAQAWPED